ncbi:Integrase zinc binding domain [Popillia japonica]|uniref:Integrase zinc binding domain n=1 Tax=Popillia japonica TaxID=7064 RepID=A0AAW1LKT6_POPJA
MDEAIDNKNPQYHFKNTYLNKINVSFNQNQGKKIYEVEVPKENNAEQIFQFIREYMDQGKHYLYFGNEKIYKDFCNVYITYFNNNRPKLYRCLRKLQVIEDEERQLEIIKNYNEGKTNHRGINETVKQLQRRYYWLNMKNIVTTYIKKCEQYI